MRLRRIFESRDEVCPNQSLICSNIVVNTNQNMSSAFLSFTLFRLEQHSLFITLKELLKNPEHDCDKR